MLNINTIAYARVVVTDYLDAPARTVLCCTCHRK